MPRKNNPCDFNDQPIPSNYFYFLNDDNNGGNTNPGTPVNDILL